MAASRASTGCRAGDRRSTWGCRCPCCSRGSARRVPRRRTSPSPARRTRSSRAPTAWPMPTRAEPAAAALAQMRREALWTIDLINVFYTGLGKSYDDGLATQRDTIAAYIRAAEPHRPAASPGLESHARDRALARPDAGRLWRGGRCVPPRPPRVRAWRSPGRRGARCSTRCSFPTTHDSASTRIPTRSWGSARRAASRSRHGWTVSDVAPGRRDEVLAVFDGILGILEQCRRELYRINGTDSRLNWMPMQFALEARGPRRPGGARPAHRARGGPPVYRRERRCLHAGPAVPGRAGQPDRLGPQLPGALDPRLPRRWRPT